MIIFEKLKVFIMKIIVIKYGRNVEEKAKGMKIKNIIMLKNNANNIEESHLDHNEDNDDTKKKRKQNDIIKVIIMCYNDNIGGTNSAYNEDNIEY